MEDLMQLVGGFSLRNVEVQLKAVDLDLRGVLSPFYARFTFKILEFNEGSIISREVLVHFDCYMAENLRSESSCREVVTKFLSHDVTSPLTNPLTYKAWHDNLSAFVYQAQTAAASGDYGGFGRYGIRYVAEISTHVTTMSAAVDELQEPAIPMQMMMIRRPSETTEVPDYHNHGTDDDDNDAAAANDDGNYVVDGNVDAAANIDEDNDGEEDDGDDDDDYCDCYNSGGGHYAGGVLVLSPEPEITYHETGSPSAPVDLSSILKQLEQVKLNDNQLQEKECCICHEEFEATYKDSDDAVDFELSKLPCSHVFHHQCLTRWLQERRLCPLCRYQLIAD